MKKFFLIVFATIAMLGCGPNKKDSSFKEISNDAFLDYDLIHDKLISWNDLLIQEKDSYLVYVFSTTCGHCNDIKQQILSYSLRNDDLYFIQYNQGIPICDSDATLTATDNVDDICIFGTPSLLTIENGFLIENIAGSIRILESI